MIALPVAVGDRRRGHEAPTGYHEGHEDAKELGTPRHFVSLVVFSAVVHWPERRAPAFDSTGVG